ncbi:MAG TPA: FdtA/QdtA family cupin domain-containing protein [Candidatus Barnesiella merdigallinarum]|nr:FdtA/QdtA family cupin domain-containing protein [Candidatus Barnesiella merdigallinarum]
MSKRVSVDDCRIIQLPKHMQESGSITVVENNRELPFAVKRVYYLYDVPGGEERGGHSHKRLYEFLVAAGGSFDVLLDDGEHTRTVTLNRPYYGLLIVPGIWRVLNNFSSGSVCLVLTSDYYDESDYVREYNDFKQIDSQE